VAARASTAYRFLAVIRNCQAMKAARISPRGATLWSSSIQPLIPDNVRARVDSCDWLVSLVITPVGFAVAGPLASSLGFTATLTGAAALGAIPCALVVLVPGVRGVRGTLAGEIAGPRRKVAVAGPADPHSL
jgi:hypothetical protein